MAITTREIRRGSSVDLKYSIKNVADLSDWVFKLQVRSLTTGNLAGVDRFVNTLIENNSKLLVTLTKEETAALRVGSTYVVGLQFDNPTTGQSEESELNILVTQDYVY